MSDTVQTYFPTCVIVYACNHLVPLHRLEIYESETKLSISILKSSKRAKREIDLYLYVHACVKTFFVTQSY